MGHTRALTSRTLIATPWREFGVTPMRRTLFVPLAVALLGMAGCAKDPVRPYPGEPTPEFRPSVDDSPEWSHDGRLIAFHRRFPSSYGPPGLYVVDAAGGTPRFLAGGDFFFPTYFRFSPDDRFIACEGGFQLLVVDLLTGQTTQPMYTANGVRQPDWDPTGRMIVYSRILAFPDDPLDSLGLHIFDTATGTDRPIYYQNVAQWGSHPAWSKDGSDIAVVQYSGTEFRILLLKPDGSDLRVLIEAAPGGTLNLLRRYARRDWGLDGLAFSRSSPSGASQPGIAERIGGSVFMNWDGSELGPLPANYSYSDAYSPDGSLGVGPRFDPADSNAVLFVFRSDDITSASYRQLTRYIPPNEQAATVHSRWMTPRPTF